ncbi:C25 family cysteine peptidase [Planctomycetota bacterium]|nr:C25 family cysteine peptidase [Planctomycetota bacterium]
MLRFNVASLAVLLSFLFISTPNAQDATAPETETESEVAPTSYLVVYASDFKEVAQQWADYRTSTGHVSETLEYAKVHETPSLDALKAEITKLYEANNDLNVLLIGDCPDAGSKDVDCSKEIPWKMSAYKDASQRAPKPVPSDNFLADVVKDNQGMPEFPIGRIPARTVEQAAIALAKVKQYESSASGEWMRDLTFFAGEGHFGPVIDGMIENLFTQFMDLAVDQSYDVRMSYANINSEYAYIPSKFSQKVIDEANKGALILTYVGHGLYDRLDNMHVKVDGEVKRYPILSSADVKDFDIKDGKLPVLVIIACQTGYMDHPKGCLAEAVVFKENAPVAVIGCSRDSHPYSNIIFQKTLMESAVGEAKTIGDAFLAAKKELIEGKDPQRPTLEMMALAVLPDKKDRDTSNEAHLRLFNLTGDPALVLRKANAQAFVAKGDTGPALSKKINVKAGSEFDIGVRLAPKMCVKEGEAVAAEGVRVELCRTRSASAPDLQEFNKKDLYAGDEEKREAAMKILAANHAASNEKVVADVTFTQKSTVAGDDDVSVIYTVKLGPGVAPGNYILKVFALDAKSGSVALANTPVKVRSKR